MSLSLSSYKGSRDLYPDDMRLRQYIFNGWREVVESYGYQEYMAPMLEPLSVYAAKSGEEIANDQTYAFSDRGGREVAIRPEMTPSVTRMVAARRQEMPLPARLYSIANFMRYERPQHGREREFWQLNFDMFGVPGLAGDTEIIKMSHDIIKHFGATDDMFTIKVNDRRLTDYIMTSYLRLNGDQSAMMIKLLDRFDKLPRDKFNDQAREILGDDNDSFAKLDQIIATTTFDTLPDEIKQSEAAKPVQVVLANLVSLGVKNAVYDARLMRGFDYYTGIVFEAFDENPDNRRSMFGGGRYDGLVAMFGVETLPVVGAAPGETMFTEFLKAHDLVPKLYPSVDLSILPMAESNNIVATKLADELRDNGINTAVDYTDRKIDKKIKAAVKAQTKWLVFVGDEETETKRYHLKNTVSGEQQTLSVDEIADLVADSLFIDEASEA